MKKLFILGLVFSITAMFCIAENVQASSSETHVIKDAIEKYKNKNYLGCISLLRMETEKDPSNTIAWYYLGNAYMNIAMKPDAHDAFDRVVMLNTVPKLTSYAIQAKLCMENNQKCEYHEFTKDEISLLRQNPVAFLDTYFANLNNKQKSEAEIEIEKLIQGGYHGRLHPDASEVILQERAKIDQSRANNKAELPRDILNIDSTQMAMLIENHNNSEAAKNLSSKTMKKMMKDAAKNL